MKAYWTKINDLNLIVVTGNAGAEMEDPLHVIDAATTMQRLHQWHRKTFFTAGEVMHIVTVNYHSGKEVIYIEAPEEFTLDVPENWTVKVSCDLPEEIQADYKEQEITGSLIVKGNGKILYQNDYTVTIPKEKSFLVRQWLHVQSLFSKDD